MWIKRFLSISVIALIMSGCGDDESSSSSLSVAGLQSIPSLSSMVKANSTSIRANWNNPINSLRDISLHVSGTPPTLQSLFSSSSNIDTYLFGGLLSTITTANTATNAQASQFFEGMGAGFLAMSVAEAIGRLLQNGTSLCYMKNVGSTPAAYTLVSGSVGDEGIFGQASDVDKIIKVNISEEGRQQTILIKVPSRATAGDVYQVKMCEFSSGTQTNQEIITIDKAAKLFTTSAKYNGQWGKGYQELTAYLSNSGDSLSFDTSKERVMEAAFSGDWGNFKGYLRITGDNIMRAKRYSNFSYEGNSGTDKNYSVCSYSGDSLKNLRFLDGGSKGLSSWGNEAHTYSVGTSYNNTQYSSDLSTSHYTEANAADLSGDAFFTSNLTVSTPTWTESCGGTVTVEVNISMDNAAMQAIQAVCEADRFDNYGNFNTAIQGVQNIVFQSQSY